MTVLHCFEMSVWGDQGETQESKVTLVSTLTIFLVLKFIASSTGYCTHAINYSPSIPLSGCVFKFPLVITLFLIHLLIFLGIDILK